MLSASASPGAKESPERPARQPLASEEEAEAVAAGSGSGLHPVPVRCLCHDLRRVPGTPEAPRGYRAVSATRPPGGRPGDCGSGPRPGPRSGPRSDPRSGHRSGHLGGCPARVWGADPPACRCASRCLLQVRSRRSCGPARRSLTKLPRDLVCRTAEMPFLGPSGRHLSPIWVRSRRYAGGARGAATGRGPRP